MMVPVRIRPISKSQIIAKLVRLKNQIPIVRLIFVCQFSLQQDVSRDTREGTEKAFNERTTMRFGFLLNFGHLECFHQDLNASVIALDLTAISEDTS